VQFDDAISKGDPRESIKKLVDPRLGDYYPVDSVMEVS
jgi:chitin elicitor receptor kinase 1